LWTAVQGWQWRLGEERKSRVIDYDTLL
jgi:hypothetical protein